MLWPRKWVQWTRKLQKEFDIHSSLSCPLFFNILKHEFFCFFWKYKLTFEIGLVFLKLLTCGWCFHIFEETLQDTEAFDTVLKGIFLLFSYFFIFSQISQEVIVKIEKINSESLPSSLQSKSSSYLTFYFVEVFIGLFERFDEVST